MTNSHLRCRRNSTVGDSRANVVGANWSNYENFKKIIISDIHTNEATLKNHNNAVCFRFIVKRK